MWHGPILHHLVCVPRNFILIVLVLLVADLDAETAQDVTPAAALVEGGAGNLAAPTQSSTISAVW